MLGVQTQTCRQGSALNIAVDMDVAPSLVGLRLQVIPNRKQEMLESFVMEIQPGTEVRTDGWIVYENLEKLGYSHIPVAVQGDHANTDQHLPVIHIVFGNLDTWLLGTHHGVSPKRLQGYLNEFVFRFNRRFWPLVAFDSKFNISEMMDKQH